MVGSFGVTVRPDVITARYAVAVLITDGVAVLGTGQNLTVAAAPLSRAAARPRATEAVAHTFGVRRSAVAGLGGLGDALATSLARTAALAAAPPP